MSEIKFKKEYLDLVKQLESINTSVIFEKDETGIIVKRSNPSTTIAYILSASPDSFSFEDEKLAFYNYPEFHQILNVFTAPTVELSENKIIISEKNSKIKYLISDAETLKAGPKKINFVDADCKLELSSDNLKELNKAINLIGAEKVNISVKGKNITLIIFNNSHDNSFEKIYEMKESSKNDFDLVISSEVFTLIPNNAYTLEVKKEGIVKIHYVNDKINLDIFTAEVEK